jgi:hypothetical protein
MLGLRKFHENERDIDRAQLAAESTDLPMFLMKTQLNGGNGHDPESTEH